MKFITYLLMFSATGINHEMLSPNAFKLTEVSVDASYGFTQTNPIKVGNWLMTDSPRKRTQVS
jgi:hypothetical protein